MCSPARVMLGRIVPLNGNFVSCSSEGPEDRDAVLAARGLRMQRRSAGSCFFLGTGGAGCRHKPLSQADFEGHKPWQGWAQAQELSAVYLARWGMGKGGLAGGLREDRAGQHTHSQGYLGCDRKAPGHTEEQPRKPSLSCFRVSTREGLSCVLPR